jgi:hypothetical protein
MPINACKIEKVGSFFLNPLNRTTDKPYWDNTAVLPFGESG